MTYRESFQRKTIIDFLQARSDHPSAAEIYRQLKTKIKNLSLGTVYRNLDILTRQGRIRALNLAQKETRYDGRVLAHAHFICEGCGKIEDLMLQDHCCQLIGCLEAEGHEVTKFDLELIGRCVHCNTDCSIPPGKTKG